MTKESVMQGQVVKPVWNSSSRREAGALIQARSTKTDRSRLEEKDLPSKYVLRWAVLGFCAAFWAGVIALVLALA